MAILAGFFGAAAGVRVRVVLLGALDLVGVDVGKSRVGSSLTDSGSGSVVSCTSDERFVDKGGLGGSRSVKISGLSVEARAWRTAPESLRFSRDSRL